MKLHPLFIAGFLWFAGCSQGVNSGLPNVLDGSPLPSMTGTGSENPNLFSEYKNQQPVQKLIYHVGPVDLLRGQSAPTKPQALQFQVTEPLWVVGFQPQVVDADGNPLSGQLLYKALLFNKHEPNPVCQTASDGNPFAIATSALTKVNLPEGFGYPLLPDDPLEAKVIFQNPTGQDYSGVSLALELIAIPMDRATGYHDVKAMLLDTDPCEHKPLSIEPGAFVQKSKTFTVDQPGNLLVANGVLSNYGVSVSLTHQNSNEATVIPFWRAEAKLDESHTIVDLTPNPFIDDQGKQINSGDKITLGVAFDNFSDDWNYEATGAAMIYFAPPAD